MRVVIDFKETDQDSKCFLANMMNRLVFVGAKFTCGSFGKRYCEYKDKKIIATDLQDNDLIINKETTWSKVEKLII